MPRVRSYKPLVLAALLSLALLVTACGPQGDGAAARLNDKGNESFAEGTYDQALAAYQSAQEKAPELAEPYYNAANALYRGQAYGDAQAQMQGALERAAQDNLAQGGHYNLGNTAFQTEDWASAVEAYKQALILDPQDHDAKYNLELALQRLQEQQNQEQEQQEQEQEEQEQDQEQQQDQSQGGEGEEEKKEEQTSEQPQDGSEDKSDQERDQGQDGEEQQPPEQQQENQDSQGEQEGQDQQNEAAGQPQNKEGEPDSEPQPGQVPPPGYKLTDEQAKQLLAAIAQDAKTLQEQLGQILIVPNRPSGQDW